MQDIVNGLKALSDETRLRIINLLYEQELCVCDIMESLQIPQTKASRHLLCLKNAGLVSDRKQAQWVYYSVKGRPKFLDELVLGELRADPNYRQDLDSLQEWLKRKNFVCD